LDFELVGFSCGRLAIHGTNRPESIGKVASYGCIRLFNQDITDLFERVEDALNGRAGETSYRPLPLVLAGACAGLLAAVGAGTLPVTDAFSCASSSSFVSTISSCWAAASWALA
jgi:L,D-transpeptidase catalytic domain